MRQPLLQTPRLWLWPARPQDLHELHACWSHPRIARHLFDGDAPTLERSAQLLRDQATLSDAGMGLWVLEQKMTGRFVGCIGLRPHSLPGPRAPGLAGLPEPVVAVLPDQWCQGFAIEALRAVVTHAFDNLYYRKLVAITDAGNAASHAMLLRAGFAPDPVQLRGGAQLRPYVLPRERFVV